MRFNQPGLGRLAGLNSGWWWLPGVASLSGGTVCLDAQPLTNEFAAYAGSASCRDCHQADYDLWAQSHHALAERQLEPGTDRVAFD